MTLRHDGIEPLFYPDSPGAAAVGGPAAPGDTIPGAPRPAADAPPPCGPSPLAAHVGAPVPAMEAIR